MDSIWPLVLVTSSDPNQSTRRYIVFKQNIPPINSGQSGQSRLKSWDLRLSEGILPLFPITRIFYSQLEFVHSIGKNLILTRMQKNLLIIDYEFYKTKNYIFF